MGVSECQDRDMLHMLKSLFSHNNTAWDSALDDVSEDCILKDNSSQPPLPTHFNLDSDDTPYNGGDYGMDIYAYLTPVIILAGLLGNTISLRVFASRSLRKLSASLYLAAISISDSMVLLTYVLLEWLTKGLPRWPGGHRLPFVNIHGVCQAYVYFSYFFRFISVWILVVFTMERYIAACRPLHRRSICTKAFGRRIILAICCVSGVLCIYKPLLSGVYRPSLPEDKDGGLLDLSSNGQLDLEPTYTLSEADLPDLVCIRNPDYNKTNLIMEVMYGLLITAVPFIVLAVFNMLILRTIMQRDANIRKWKIAFKDSRIRWEFTVTLLAVSSSFICLNLPYFVTWCQQFVQSINADDPIFADEIRNQLFFTKVVFYFNYCINFFLYCLSGTYYRRQLVVIFCCRKDEHAPNGTIRKFSTSYATGTTKV